LGRSGSAGDTLAELVASIGATHLAIQVIFKLIPEFYWNDSNIAPTGDSGHFSRVIGLIHPIISVALVVSINFAMGATSPAR
jgi:hypothetical protein